MYRSGLMKGLYGVLFLSALILIPVMAIAAPLDNWTVRYPTGPDHSLQAVAYG